MKHLLLLPLILVSHLLFAQSQNERLFVFGHSLIDHRPPAIATPSDETTVPHWLQLFAQEAGHTIAAGGQYGFLHSHRNNIINGLVQPQWGYDIVPGVWDIDNETFAEADMTSVMITAGNFIQNELSPTDDYFYGEGAEVVSPISATHDIVDWVEQQEPGTRLFIYENWPETNLAFPPPMTAPTYPISAADFAIYNTYTQAGFHDWWIDYHDQLLASRPDLNIRMIPVGPTLAKLFGTNLANQVPYTELYEDLDPHGRATLYFLAAMVTYAALYQEEPPATFVVPNIVHEDIRNNYVAISAFIWAELQAFNTPAGESRVFSDAAMPVSLSSFTAMTDQDKVVLSWATASENGTDRFVIERQVESAAFSEIGSVPAAGNPSDYQFTDDDPLEGTNMYRLRIVDQDGSTTFSSVVTAEISGTTSLRVVNRGGRQFQLYGLAANSQLSLVDGNGRVVFQTNRQPAEATLDLPPHLPPGIYYLIANSPGISPRSSRVVIMR
ncbi:fibronectin type III domain-containing protein [Neolewinella agarilytica]|uniref:Por secretion system C-terminal sorting domain-containing protein n=1 Tax=Neolewinella agarilytica TaxID=478744 RepID=A0A1H9C1P9_9BACT|nr:hypothetical protein [Neolewinella agarilytica]SEP95109.1 hypothetical protein SAMN05444359_10435 [Neolewinella agarilytica]